MTEITDEDRAVLMAWRQEALDALKLDELEIEDRICWGKRASALSKLLSSGWPKSSRKRKPDYIKLAAVAGDPGDLLASARVRACDHIYNVDDWEFTYCADQLSELSQTLERFGDVMRIGLLTDAGIVYGAKVITTLHEDEIDGIEIALFGTPEEAQESARASKALSDALMRPGRGYTPVPTVERSRYLVLAEPE